MQRQLSAFSIVLDYCLAANGHRPSSVLATFDLPHDNDAIRPLSEWRSGKARPVHRKSHQVLRRIEHLYGLPEQMFANLLAEARSPLERLIRGTNPSQQTALRWHIPYDFDRRSLAEQEKIVGWAKENILPCTTDYGRYQSKASQSWYSIVFPSLAREYSGRRAKGVKVSSALVMDRSGTYGTAEAPVRLAREMESLLSFRTMSLPQGGLLRAGRWRASTANYQVRRYGEVFGSLASAPFSSAAGRGVPLLQLTFALLVFPQVWDWHLQWRERRRGFLTAMERSLMYEVKSSTRNPTGWLRQNPQLSRRITPIEGLLNAREIAVVAKDWEGACDRMFNYASSQAQELHRTLKMHRDPFAAILPCLEADKPLVEYKKVGDEILRLLPQMATPQQRASTLRNYVMFRLGLHLGLRQRNLRELLLCPKGGQHSSAHKLDHIERGEMQWRGEAQKWVVTVPASAFKNRTSSFFGGRAWELELPDLEGLYDHIQEYLSYARPLLLHGASDPQTVLVRKIGRAEAGPEFDIQGFYAAWKRMIQIFGIYNPFTKRGAIKGLLPHGPHCTRDILATHVLKETCSYELAAFAIQDNADSVKRHYGRFLPKEKAAKAAEILNRAWSASPTNSRKKLSWQGMRSSPTFEVVRPLNGILW
jgi:hypothetical protein